MIRARIFVERVKHFTDEPRNTGTVYELNPLEKISSMVDSTAGMTMGSVIRLMIFQRPALSSVALSSSVASMFLRMPPIRR